LPSLNELEKAVLEEIVRQAPDDLRGALKEQVEGAELISRENTGQGFFTTLKPGKVSTTIKPSPVGDVLANIEGFAQPMTFLLFLKDGAIRMLEGAAILDETASVDFSNVRFTILPDRPVMRLPLRPPYGEE